MREYKQCNRCVMDTTDPDIQFDEQGFCNHCNWLIQKKKEAEQLYEESPLHKLVKKIKRKGRNKQYDCLLGISGGVDSCYTAYLLKKLGLRTLLVHMDNGWDAEHSVINIKRVVDRLGFDYESYVLDWQEFKDLQRSFLKASVIEADTPTDIAILGALHQKAGRNKSNYIIMGGNNETEGILPKYWHYNAKDTRYLKSIQNRFGSMRIDHLPRFGFLQECYYKFFKRIKIIYLLNYIRFTPQEVMTTLTNEFGYKNYGSKHHESRYTRFIQSFLLPKKFNIDYRKATLSCLICSGEIQREEALKILSIPSYQPEYIRNEKDFIAKKLEMPLVELEHIIELPPKTYRDYPNQEKWLEFFYRIYRRLFR